MGEPHVPVPSFTGGGADIGGEQLPDFIREAFAVTDGEVAQAAGLPSPFGSGSVPPGTNPLSRDGKTLQERVIEAKSPKRFVYEIVDPRVVALDLAEPGDARELERITAEFMPRAMADRERYYFRQTELQNFPDPNSPRGFRVITTLQYGERRERVETGPWEHVVVGTGANPVP